MSENKLNIDKTSICVQDKCPDCNKALVRGINYSGWHSYHNVDGVLVSAPTCDSCIVAYSKGGEKQT